MSRKPSIGRELAWRAIILYQKTGGDPGKILRSIDRSAVPDIEINLAWEITNGSIRFLRKLDYIAQSFVPAPIHKQKPEVMAALRIGLYQLLEMSRIPDYAAVDETVNLVKNSLSEREAGFVNAILRRAAREKVEFPDRSKDRVKFLADFYSYPEWLVRRWLKFPGESDIDALLAAGNARPLLNVKVITSRIDRDGALAELQGEGIIAEKSPYFPDFITCENRSAVLKSRTFAEGYINVQDQSQGIPVYLLDPPSGARVLDLCAAPGGKSIAVADRTGPDGLVVSLDSSRDRLAELKENQIRTGLQNIEIVERDLFEFATPEKFGYILLDVPCSGLGNIAGNADMRWTRKEKDVGKLAAIQAGMIRRAAAFLEHGGCLVYSTCTTEREEIEDIIYAFLKEHNDFRLEDGNSPLVAPFKSDIGIYRSWMHKHAIDGGGFARLVKSDGV